MENMKTTGKPHPVITQTKNNTTLWIGHLQTDPTDHFAGQIFRCPEQGTLDNIQIFAAAVQHPGELSLSVHVFDTKKKQWGPPLSQCTVQVQKNDADKWLRFTLPAISLNKNETYGFRLQASNAMIAIGEAATVKNHPFDQGQEWHGDSKDQHGHFYQYFSLAYKVEMVA
jgi:hypothetical protein